MGIDIYCGDKSFYTSYSTWCNIRTQIIHSTFEFLDHTFEETEAKRNQDEEEEDADYQFWKDLVLQMKEEVRNAQPKLCFGTLLETSLEVFLKVCGTMKYLNALNYFQVGGLFALCNQSFCEGFYAPGNSLDICQLLDKIEPFLKDTWRNAVLWLFIHRWRKSSQSIVWRVSE